MPSLEEEIDKFAESRASDQSSSVILVKELTNEKVDTDEMTNMDFKTRLKIKELCAHGCLEWLNDVVAEPTQLYKKLVIVDLIKRMKRLRVSEEGKAREALENISIRPGVEDDKGWFKRFMGMGGSGV